MKLEHQSESSCDEKFVPKAVKRRRRNSCKAGDEQSSGKVTSHGAWLTQNVIPDKESKRGDGKDFCLNATLYHCNFCMKKLSQKVLLHHMHTKHNPKILPQGCRFCVIRFKTSSELKLHEHGHMEETPSTLFCDKCGASGNRKKGMKHHMINDHLTSSSELESQIQYVKNKKKSSVRSRGESLKCEKCSETLKTKSELRLHLLTKHELKCRELLPNEIKIVRNCCVCAQDFDSDHELLMHIEAHRTDFMRLTCQHNHQSITSFDKFEHHCQYHLKPKTHECMDCHKLFALDEKLLQHVESHGKKRTISCAKCDCKLRSLVDLDAHDKVKHQNLTLFICPFCAKSFARKTGLDIHIKNVHNKEKRLECSVCKYKFNTRAHLRRHEATHSAERSKICEQCGKAFKTKESLAIHVRRHEGTNPLNFSCNQPGCTFKFPSKNRLETHMLTHTGLVNYFASKSEQILIEHVFRNHTGVIIVKQLTPVAVIS